MKTHALEVFDRRAEYTRKHNVRIKIGSWNVASLNGTQDELSKWFTPDTGEHAAQEDIGLYVLGLQEIVDVSSPAEAFRPYVDTTVANRWKESASKVLPSGYELVAAQQLVGLLLLIYASPSIYSSISYVSTTSVGTGLLGYMGNKGAVSARILLGDVTRLAFVNVHMAAGADSAALQRRNWDAAQITTRTRFSAITGLLADVSGSAEMLNDQDYVFWFGDLNYRLQGMPGEDVRRLLEVHSSSSAAVSDVQIKNKDNDSDWSNGPLTTIDLNKPNSGKESSSKEKASSNFLEKPEEEQGPSKKVVDTDASSFNGDIQDPASLQTTIASLLPHDELLAQQRSGTAFFDGWTEGSINFLPTYKYDVGSVDSFDSSEKKRCPSWCDRILYRTRASKEKADANSNEKRKASLKDEDMEAKGLVAEAEDELSMFEYDPQLDGENLDEQQTDQSGQMEEATDGFVDRITLERYCSHQIVTASDHKPLEAIFSMQFDAFVPELKAQISQEVSREMDKLENEERPTVTFVIEAPSTNQDKPPSGVEQPTAVLDFGDVRYAEPKSRNMTIANTGQVPASVSFKSEPNPSSTEPYSALPSWLLVEMDVQEAGNGGSSEVKEKSCTLDPGDTCAVRLTVSIDDLSLVKQLNSGTENLDRIIFLRIEDGRDSFITVKGRWLWSCFAQSISTLIRVPEGGIRKLQRRHEQNDAKSPDDEDDVKWSSPRELFKLTECVEDLVVRTIADWNMRHRKDPLILPPWQQLAGWPFASHDQSTQSPLSPLSPSSTPSNINDMSSTSKSNDNNAPSSSNPSSKHHLRLSLYETLDNDQPIRESNLYKSTANLTTKTEIAAETLLLFLHSLVDGIISAANWIDLEPVLITDETLSSRKSSTSSTHYQNQPPQQHQLNQEQLGQDSCESRRSAVLEVLGMDSSVHSVSFVIVMSMLSRVLAELNPVDADADTGPNASVSPSSTSTSKSAFGAVEGSGAATTASTTVVMRDKLAERKLAELFADALVRVPVDLEAGTEKDKKTKAKEKEKEKERRVLRERKIRLVEMFLE